MITTICIWWIGIKLSAPMWFYVALLLSLVLKVLGSVRDTRFNRKIREHLKNGSAQV